jgi:hypothetical protein
MKGLPQAGFINGLLALCLCLITLRSLGKAAACATVSKGMLVFNGYFFEYPNNL